MDFEKDFKFTPPETMPSASPAVEQPEPTEMAQTPDEMGSAVIEAVKSGSAMAVYEAVKKIVEG